MKEKNRFRKKLMKQGEQKEMEKTVGMPRLIIVSNRLPITIKKKGDSWQYSMSSGGLVSFIFCNDCMHDQLTFILRYHPYLVLLPTSHLNGLDGQEWNLILKIKI
jgi:hypothetical protein